uniref:Uncharacterized protein n=1 Tax=Lepeophtheirus salmonis TaxID=72036 RepID=A0A0K2TPG4_LEPSM
MLRRSPLTNDSSSLPWNFPSGLRESLYLTIFTLSPGDHSF